MLIEFDIHGCISFVVGAAAAAESKSVQLRSHWLGPAWRLLCNIDNMSSEIDTSYLIFSIIYFAYLWLNIMGHSHQI